MCGIFFYNTNNIEKGDKTIGEVFSVMKHRGPDNTTIKFIDKFLFCHHRLAIINSTSSGEQPIIKNDIVLIANGEIYNYKKISNSLMNDCESIINLYISNELSKLDGDFAFILYDKTKRVIVSGRDPVGLKPLYIGYSKSGNPIAFSSEIKALSLVEAIKDIKEHPINTINFYNIDMHGNIHENKNNQIIDYDTPVLQQTYETSLMNIRKLLDISVKKRIDHTDRPFAFLCSGGIDSVIIVSIAAKLGIPIHVFTLRIESNFSYDEIYADMYINELKNTCNLKYTKVNFSIEEGLSSIEEVIKNIESYDPNTIRASIPMYLLAKYIKENTDYKVIISGEGSDELFMGYNYFSIKNPTNEQAEKESTRLIKGLHSFDILRAERCFSCHGLELRVPFLDKDLISTVIKIPGSHRLPKNGIEKYILRDAYKDMSIPDKILYRQKERMSDGIGFKWVPSLINYCSQSRDNNDTDEKMKKEKEYYINIYKKYYKYNTIIFRELPDWAMSEKVSILGN